MKIICTKSDLVHAVSIVSKAVSNNTTLPILKCILIEASTGNIKLTANDMELGIETTIDGQIHQPGKIAIEAKLFSEIVRKLPDNDITIETDDQYKATITCEKACFQIMGQEGEEFPSLPEIVKNQSATSTIQALSTCYCLAIPMKKARLELTNDRKFLKFTCESLAEKLAAVSMNSSINLLYPLENRLASYINEFLTNDEDSNIYIDFDENLVNIAELLGSSYRHLLRTLNTLSKKGVLEKEDGKYKVINKVLLEELAGDLYQDAKFM